MDFYIQHFDDYHDIEAPPGYRALELGCFPTLGWGHNRYYGLFYSGRRPAIKRVMEELLETVLIDPDASGELGPGNPYREEWLEYNVRSAFGLKEKK